MSKQNSFARNVIPGAAVLLFAGGVAHAQSNVTLFGEVDGGLLYTSKTLDFRTGKIGGDQFAMIDSGSAPSLFGLQGSEDLGGGLKATFRLESGISIANGSLANSNGNQFGRQAWVALGGKFGEVKAGLQFSPFFVALWDSDPRDFSPFGSGLVNYVNNVYVTGMFNSNAVSYKSPTIAGLQVRLMMALGGKAGDFQAGRQYSASLKYDNGPLMVNAAIYDGNSGGTVQTTIPSTVAFEGRTVGAAYKFGPLTVKASFVNYKVAGSFNNNVYGAGFGYFVLPQLNIDGGVWTTSDRNRSANHSLMAALGTHYFLSKATTLYAQVAVVNNHGKMDTGLSVNDATFAAPGTTTGVQLGIRHLF